ncbi:MAG TPA: aminopeptidase P family protein [Candidatus Hydrogenedentes bacterium]|nr:aminopeptidase P family protein [Candidatus Hydrogenedentota bacterium]
MIERLARLREHMAAAACDAFVSVSPPANQYLAAFTGSTSAIIVTANDALFLCDFRYTEQARDQVRGFTIEQVDGALEKTAGERLAKLGAKRAAFDPAVVTVAQHARLCDAFGGALEPLADIVASLRRVKDQAEIQRIREAVRLSEDVLAALVDGLEEGVRERELAARFEYEFKRRGATDASFPTITLFGEHSSVVHGEPGERALEEGDIVLLDFGCRLDGYCSDLTRTYAFGRIPGSWFEEVYLLTLNAQQQALGAIRPGMTCRDLDAVARSVIENAGYGDRFGHGLGHGVGIEVHEEPRLHKTSEDVLREGTVITIEPGIYLPGRGGVRIEDLVVVSSKGCDCLSSAPKELRILET